jgi:hypothetical protein
MLRGRRTASWASVSSPARPAARPPRSSRVPLGLLLAALALPGACKMLEGPGDAQRAAVAHVLVVPDRIALTPGQTAQLLAVPLSSEGSPVPDVTVEWRSSDTAVAVVSSPGEVTARNVGRATITARAESVEGQATVEVSELPPPVASVTVLPESATLEPGASLQLAAVVRDSAGNVLAGRRVAWTSADTAIARVDSTGLVTALAPGATPVTATSEGVSGSATVTVTAPGASPPVLFESSWATATGRSEGALLDGGKWTHIDCPSPLLEVVASGASPFGQHPGSLNALVVDGTSDGSCEMIHRLDAWAPSYRAGQRPPDFAIRFYVNYRQRPGMTDHSVQSGTQYQTTWALSADDAGSAGWVYRVLTAMAANPYDLHSWVPYDNLSLPLQVKNQASLALNTWYRIELLFKFNSATQFRVYPRIYAVTNLADGSGPLLYDWDRWGHFDPTAGSPSDRRTLANWYGAGGWLAHRDEEDPSEGSNGGWNELMIGNNGSTSARAGTDQRAIVALKVVDGSTLSPSHPTWVGDLRPR